MTGTITNMVVNFPKFELVALMGLEPMISEL